MPRGRNKAEGKRQHKFSTSSIRSSYWTKPLAEGIKKPGPKKRGLVYREAIDKVINSSFMDEWCTSEQIAYEANKHISNHWTQLSTFSVCAILRKYEKDGKIAVNRKQKKYYRKKL